jgi:dipeptidyl-peptidase-4
MVPSYPIVDYAAKPAKVKNLRYPMAGTPSHHVTLGVYNLKTLKTVYINPDSNGFKDPEQYITNVTWSNDDKYIYIAVVNRDQNHCKLQRFWAFNGTFDKTLFEEKHPKYVEPEHGPIFLGNTVGLPKNQFLWYSKRDGHNHLYLYQTDGSQLMQVTSGNYDVLDVIAVQGIGAVPVIYAQVTANNGLSKHLLKIVLSSTVKPIYTEINKDQIGLHTGKVSPSGKYLVDSYSTPDIPYEAALLENAANPKVFYTAANPLAEHQFSKPLLVKLKGKDTNALFGRIVRPANFDSTKKYPVVVYVYGGPHAQLVTNGFNYAAELWMFHFAQQGYIVFTLDGRGSANRGA